MKKIRKSLIIAYLCAIVTSAAAQQDSRFFTGECSDIHPKGWLETMLQRQHDGLTGHPEALSRIKTLYFYYFGRTEAFSHFDERVKVFAAEVTEPDALEKAAEANPSFKFRKLKNS